MEKINNSLSSIHCPLCDNPNPKIIYSRNLSAPSEDSDWAHMTRDVYADYGKIVKCKNCSMVFQAPSLSDEKILSAYQNLVDEEYVGEQDCRCMNAFLSLRVIKKYKSNGRLLDIGSSAGFFLNAARLEFEPFGLEPSQWAVNFATEKLGLKVKQGSVDNSGYEPESFDVVTMVDVIEHLPNPKHSISQVSRLLKKDGLLYLVTPDVGSLSAWLLGRFWWGFRPSHLTYFSKKTLTRLLTESGYKILTVNSYGRLFSMGYWLSRIRNYPHLFYGLAKFITKIMGISEKVVYINTRDSMEICAQKIN